LETVYVSTVSQNPLNQPTPKHRAYRNAGLENTSCWYIQWIDSSKILGSYTDMKGTRSTDGGISWANMNEDTAGNFSVNTTYQTIYHAPTNKVYAATSSIHDMYESTYLTDSRIDGGTGQIFSSSDSGRTWSLIHNFSHPVILAERRSYE